MSLYNLPDGCLDASDLDYYDRINPPQRCRGCKQAEQDCECCRECGATPEQACEPNCGLGDVLPDLPNADILEYWQDRSDLFEPPRNDYHGPVGVE